MAGIYVYSDKKEFVPELISLAVAAGKPAFVITYSQETAREIIGYGAEKIYVLKGESVLAENYAKATAEFLQSEAADLFVVGATPRGRDIAARVAGYLDCAMVSDITTIKCTGEVIETERSIYGGAVVQTEILDGFSVVTIPAGKFEATAFRATSGSTDEIETISVKADTRVSVVSRVPISKDGVNLKDAEKVVCIGLGMDKEEDIQMARELARIIGAEIACTRGIAEENHWLPVSSVIGISGAVIKAKLYLGMGVSGQIQHVYGIREAKIIVAVDSNKNAPIFKAADYGIVGDMYEIVPLLTAALK